MIISITNNSVKYIFKFKKNLIGELISSGYEVWVIAPSDKYTQSLIEMGVKFHNIDLKPNSVSVLSEVVAIGQLILAYSDIRPSFNLTFTAKPNVYGTLVGSFFRVKTICNITGLGSTFIRGGPVLHVLKGLYRLAFLRAFHVFSRLVKHERSSVIPGSGVDLVHFAFRPVVEKRDDQLVFLFIGRLIRDKGIVEFLEAARSLRERGFKFRFLVLGEHSGGNRSAVSRTELDEWLEEGIIEYLGEVEDVRTFMEASDAVVLPSYREGLPRVLLEAMAVGRPIITTDAPGCREVVCHGKNGFCVETGSADAVADAMLRFGYLTFEERSEMGRYARQFVVERFDEKAVIGRYLSILKEVEAADTSQA